MQYEFKQKPDFATIRVQFEQPGESMLVEPAAMVARDTAIEMKTAMTGGLLGAAKRKLLGGESVFQNTFTATAPGQTLWLAPGPEGDIEVINCDGQTPVFLNSGAFLASAPSVQLNTKWGGAKGFFTSASMFLLKADGVGPLFFSCYGGIHAVDVGDYGYVVDNNHILGWTGNLEYSVRKVGGLKSLFLSGEGLVAEFRGRGRLWISTRNPGSLASFLHKFRRVQRSSS